MEQLIKKETAFTELGKISRELYDLHLMIWAGDNPLEIDLNVDWGRIFEVIDERLNDVKSLVIKRFNKELGLEPNKKG